MKLVFKSDTYGFHLEITNPLIAKRFKEYLPLSCKVIEYNNSICFNIHGLDVAMEDSSLRVKEGDVVWNYNNDYLCIYVGSMDGREREITPKGIKAGHILASLNEMRQLKNGSIVSISLLEEKRSSLVDNKILSQSEIDTLVKELLNAKREK